MTFARVLSGVVVGLCLLLMVLFSLLFTQVGNQWLWGIAKQQVAGLDGTLASGQLGEGWHFTELSYEQDSLAFSARDIHFGWQLGKLLDRRLWLQELVAEDLEITIKYFPDSTDEPKEPLADITPPLRIDLDKVRADRVTINLPGQTIAWQSVEVGVHWDKEGMVITGPNMNGLVITLDAEDATKQAGNTLDEQPESEKQAQAQKQAKAAGKVASPEPLFVLPEIVLPFPIKLQEFSLTDSKLIQNGEIQALHALQLELEGRGSEIKIITASLDHELATVQLGGHVTLTGDYPLDLALSSTVKKPLLDGQLAGQTVAATLTDNLAKLKGKLVLGGVLNAQASLSAEPLNPQLPFDLALNWQQLGWPFNDPEWRLEQGKLRLKGRLEDYTLTLSSEAHGPDLPPVGIKLSANGDLKGAKLKPLTLMLPKGEVQVDGKVSWSDGINWQGILALSDVDPGVFVEGMDGKLNGKLDTRFVLQGEKWTLNAEPDIKGFLRDYPLSLKGQVSLNQALQGSIKQLQLTNADNKLTVNGDITDRWQLDGVLSAPNLAVYAPGLYGDLAGDIKVRGALKSPELNAELTGKTAGFNDNEAKDIRLQANASLGDKAKGQQMKGDLRLTIDRIRSGEMRIDKLQLIGSGNEAAHRLSLNFKGDPLAADLNLTGSLGKDGWRGRLTKGELNTPLDKWALQQDWLLAYQGDTFNAQPHCWRSGKASVCFDAIRASAAKGQAGLQIRDLDLARLKPFFPNDFSWEATLGGTVALQWNGKLPKINANISTTPGTFVSNGTRLAYQTLSLTSEMSNNQLRSTLDFRSTKLGEMGVQANVADLNGKRALSGNLKIEQLKLDWLAPLLPEVARLQGTLAGQGRFEGTLAAPLLFGNISLTGGEIDTYSDMVKVRDFTTRLDIRGTNATINGQLKVGDGPLYISGELDWRQLPVSGEIRLRGHDLEAGYPGMGRVRVSPDMTITLGEVAKVRGRILIPWARIEVKELPDSAVSLSSDVIIVDSSGIIPETAPSLPIDIRIQVQLLEDVRLAAFGLKTRLEGKLNIVQRPNRAMRATGEIRLVDGKFKAYGQNLLIREGSILFNGPLDVPNLKVEAVRNPSTLSDSSITVGVRVTGTAQQPELLVFSEPGMPQAEQLSYLLRGRGLDGSGDTDGNALVQSMLLGAGVGKVGGVVTNIGESLGLKDVMLDTGGSGDDTEVNITAYVLPGLQISYGVGVFSSIGELRLRYELLPRLYLQAASGLNQAIDLFYRFEF
ncbi:translocation/assembly module TamB domain-containing protein [Oceanisphaera sp. IT1-181]|uniref:autotransporter assembly complex protein TamB n=1 Tax=Oceanisphaera sp. IT1-181 TaxID=3081199 RepID=UPI0029C9CE07|nr:translocation/assembly module TamB domain-containing protein [Oceanisphaera sp. IT1-181]